MDFFPLHQAGHIVDGKMPLDPRAVHIYTDGSCYRNPGGSSGCAAIVQYPEHLGRSDEQIVDFGCSESSNNRMELLACIQALNWIRTVLGSEPPLIQAGTSMKSFAYRDSTAEL